MRSWLQAQSRDRVSRSARSRRDGRSNENQIDQNSTSTATPIGPPPVYNKANSLENLRFDIQRIPEIQRTIFNNSCDLDAKEFKELYPGICDARETYMRSLARLIISNPVPFSSFGNPADPFLKSTWMTLEGLIKLSCYSATKTGKSKNYERVVLEGQKDTTPKLELLKKQYFKTLILIYYMQGAILDGTLGQLLKYCETDYVSQAFDRPSLIDHDNLLEINQTQQEYFEGLAESLLFRQIQGSPPVWIVPALIRHYCAMSDEEYKLWYPDLVNARNKFYRLTCALYIKASEFYNFEFSSYPGLPT